MLSLEEVRKGLKDRRLFMISRATGIHPNTLRYIRDDPNANPTYKIMVALSEYLKEGAVHG